MTSGEAFTLDSDSAARHAFTNVLLPFLPEAHLSFLW